MDRKPLHHPDSADRTWFLRRKPPALWRLVALATVRLSLVTGLGPAPAGATPGPTPAPAAPAAASYPSYLVQPAQPDALIKADASPGALAQRAQAQQQALLSARLQQLAQAGEVGSYSYDSAAHTFRADLSDAAVASLTKDPTVASLRPAFAAPTGAAPVATPALTGPTGPASIDYVQVYTPFMWGKVGEGGLTVAITLTDSSGTKVLGVPVQTTETPPSTVQIDRTSLYFETVFVNPANTKENVIIMPGDQVTVVTSLSGVPEDTRNIPVYDVHAYTNYTTNSVSGSTTAPPAQWPSVYVTSGPLSLNDYLTTTSNLDYAQTTIGADGSFAVSSSDFVTPVTFKQGSTGFVRVERSDGSEIYTVHGQNNFVLENSNVMHGYAYDLPTAPSGLQTGVTVVRPAPTVTAILANGQGSQLSQGTATPIIQPWSVAFGQTISAGDIVTVSINGSPPVTINVPTLTGQINLAANEITGTGPANSTLTLGVGQIDGYVSKYSYFYYYQSTPTTNASGSFSVGSVSCGTNQSVSFKPGSFAYVGYYDGNGNMIYLDFAAPRTDVMANFNYLDGWIADGTDNPTVTVKNSNGAVLEETTTGPTLLWLLNQDLYVDVYYALDTTTLMTPGDTVGVASGGQSWTIPVDQLTAYPNVDGHEVTGQAPAGQTVVVIPDLERGWSNTVVASGSGAYVAGNPFSTFTDSTCATGSGTVTFAAGIVGRAYLTHSDGNRVFAVWGRTLNINEQDNLVEVYAFPTQNIDWDIPSTITVTVTLTPPGGSPIVGSAATSLQDGDAKIDLLNDGNKVLIEPGDTVTATFPQGVGGTTTTATLTLAAVPIVTGSPDPLSGTLAGLAPPSWPGQATLSETGINPVLIAPQATAFFPALTFVNGTKPEPLLLGYSGTVSFSDFVGDRVWAAWAVTQYPVRITGILEPAGTQVCGTAQPNIGITVQDWTNQPQDTIIGSATADGSGRFCAPVSPPLYKDQVVVAVDSNNTISQPVLVGATQFLFLPAVFH